MKVVKLSKITQIDKIFPGIEKNVSLKNYTTFRIGGRAKYFLKVESSKKLVRIIKTARTIGMPFFILGGGSNILFPDDDIPYLVIKINIGGLKLRKIGSRWIMKVGAGVSLASVVQVATEKSLSGLEWAIGIPGTVGGALFGNAGAFGKSIGDLVKSVEVFDAEKMKIKKLSKKECRFGYKDSIFKRNKKLVILRAELALNKAKKEEIKTKIREFIEKRTKTQPLNFPSAGCIFKNIEIDNRKHHPTSRHSKKFLELEKFIRKGMIPTGYLIDKLGLKGKTIGGAKISEVHANFIVNTNDAKSKDVVKLINLIKKKVRDIFGFVLQEEVQIIRKDNIDRYFWTLDNKIREADLEAQIISKMAKKKTSRKRSTKKSTKKRKKVTKKRASKKGKKTKKSTKRSSKKKK